MRDRLIELIGEAKAIEASGIDCKVTYEYIADYLLANGVIVTPCVAMVEQFTKNGKFDTKNVRHNGKYAVVFVDESLWKCPLISITEKYYDDEKAREYIEFMERNETEFNV